MTITYNFRLNRNWRVEIYLCEWKWGKMEFLGYSYAVNMVCWNIGFITIVHEIFDTVLYKK